MSMQDPLAAVPGADRATVLALANEMAGVPAILAVAHALADTLDTYHRAHPGLPYDVYLRALDQVRTWVEAQAIRAVTQDGAEGRPDTTAADT
jgi:hypothetical protein